jgi:hypothetical protein
MQEHKRYWLKDAVIIIITASLQNLANDTPSQTEQTTGIKDILGWRKKCK